MKRIGFAVAAGLLAAMLSPATTMAAASLDQFNNPAPGTSISGGVLGETFQANASGLLTSVQLYMNASSGSATATVLIETQTSGQPSGTVLTGAAGPVGTAVAWYTFTFSTPLTIDAGDSLAIVVDTSVDKAWWGSGDQYGRGAAWTYSGSWVAQTTGLLDFAFRTYVDPQTATIGWGKTQIPGGQSTALSPSFSATFPGIAGGNPTYTLQMTDPPSWYTDSPTYTLTCSSQISVANCNPMTLGNAAGFTATQDGNPIVISMTASGTGSPALSDIGTSATITITACAQYPRSPDVVIPAAGELKQCVQASAVLTVGQAPTPPPSNTVESTRLDGSAPGALWALAGLVAALGVLFVGRRRLARR